MGLIGRGLSFGFGFALALAVCVGLNFAYRGAWLPMLLAVILAFLFGAHPRLAKTPGTLPYCLAIGFLVTGMWMRGAEPIVAPTVRPYALKLPGLLLLLGAIATFWFLIKNFRAKSELFLYLPASLLLLVMATVIANFSGGSGGTDPMVDWAKGFLGLGPDAAYTAIIILRKCVHFFGYGLLAWVAYRLANPRFHLSSAVAFGLSVALVFAVFDEFRQLSSPVRNGSPWDIGLDFAGAATVVGISVLRYRQQLKRKDGQSRSSS